jgi:signal transduction histidine kinase
VKSIGCTPTPMTKPLRARQSVLAHAVRTSAILLSVFTVMIGLFFGLAMRSVIRAYVRKEATSIVRSFAVQFYPAVLVRDEKGLTAIATQLLAVRDVMFVVISDRQGNNFRMALPGFPLDRLPKTLEVQPESFHRTWSPRFDYVEANSPIVAPGGPSGPHPAPVGMLRVGISVEEPKAAFFQALSGAICGSLVCLALILWFRWAQLKRLLDPLQGLARFTAEVGEETLDRRAEVSGGEEIASLAESFNLMLDRLRETMVSKDRLEQANKAKSQFLAGLSHELRTPLNAIIGYSELLDEECQDRGIEVLRPDLRRIRNAGRVLLDQMNDLLDYAKLEADRTQIKVEDVSVSGVIREVADTVDSIARKNGNLLRIPPNAEMMVVADRLRFRQCLLNLVVNACKFTENGTVSIAVRTVDHEGKHWCQVEVRDTGIGIAREKFGQLFEPFVQLEPSATRRYGGTGLGLSISRKYCRLMGGDINVESEVGSGSKFTLSLPASPQDWSPAVEMRSRSHPVDLASGKITSR